MSIEAQDVPSKPALERSADGKVTIILPREVYDELIHLMSARKIARGDIESEHTNAITGDQHPLHSSGRGVR